MPSDFANTAKIAVAKTITTLSLTNSRHLSSLAEKDCAYLVILGSPNFEVFC